VWLVHRSSKSAALLHPPEIGCIPAGHSTAFAPEVDPLLTWKPSNSHVTPPLAISPALAEAAQMREAAAMRAASFAGINITR
jgi:hypothetical protein